MPVTYKLDIHCTTVLYQLTYSFLQSLCLILPQFYGIVWNIGVLKVSLDPLCHQLARFIIVDFIGPSLTSNHDVTSESTSIMPWAHSSSLIITFQNVILLHSFPSTDSSVGAGIDSYYEYCLKAYILFGDETYLERFNRVWSHLFLFTLR